MSDKTTYYQINKETILNRVKKYYNDNKERLKEQARNKYRKLTEEEKNKRNRYHNMFE